MTPPLAEGYVLDTSVAIAWYFPEAFSESARTWRERFLDEEIRLVVPDLHYWELANVLRTFVRRGDIEAADARRVYGHHLVAP